MLLTSSQVSFAVSAGIVCLCTFALFLSGYVIQQRTLRQLRQSIREPRPEPPKVFLPDRFKKMTTELEDGSVITIDDEGNGDNEGDDNEEDAIVVAANAPSRSQASPAVGGPADVEIVVTLSTPDDKPQQRLGEAESEQAAETEAESEMETNADKTDKSDTAKTDTAKAKAKPKPVSKAERRRLIKEELLRLSRYEKPVYYQRRLY